VHGGNRFEAFLAPSFQAPGAVVASTAAAAAPELSHGVEFGLMGISILAAFAGIGLATLFYLNGTERAEAMARRFRGLYRLLVGKYFVDEAYNAVIVQPIKRASTLVLWRGVDAGLIDGTVNGVGLVVRGWSAVLRRLQTGSVRAYAMSFFVGVVMIVGYYLWR
jgi:NADH-quinone oxidoreductase subunit L